LGGLSRSLVLFTRDLRVRDNAALSAAADADRMVPLFVFDERLLSGRCGAPNRLAHLRGCLVDLDASLRERGARLIVRRGDPVDEALAVAREAGVEEVNIAEDVSGYAKRRRNRLAAACEESGVELRTHPGTTIAEPGAVLPPGGDHYRVFTPYFRAWSELPRRPVRGAPRRLSPATGVRVGRLPALERLSAEPPSPRLIEAGESAARKRLDSWLRSGLAGYEEGHDDLAGARTSRLSADLHFGSLSANEVLERVEGRPGGAAFARQLCWRDFHHQVLAAFPELPRADYRRRGKRWRSGDGADAEAWRRGRTGVPIVDAGMRQLAAEGFMHNRARLLVASFLTRTLGVDWRVGAAHFETLLADADLANNSGNWQWVAGTGNDTRPNRAFSPLRQAFRFDPDGSYVRRHVPELAAIAGSAVHEPWKLAENVRSGLDYPEPIVEL
jgi:deoxyribodipyrimidine photo-lyase